MSISDGRCDFDEWILDEFRERGAFTALVILVEIGARSVTPVTSTYLNVIGNEINWLEIVALFAGAGVHWDGASFYPVTAPDGAARQFQRAHRAPCHRGAREGRAPGAQ